MAREDKRIGAICEVTWLDACGVSKGKKEEIEDVMPYDLLVKTKTYGILYKKDKEALIIVQEDSEEECDYTVIPLSWIVDIKVLNNKKGGKNGK